MIEMATMTAFQAACIVSVQWGNPYTDPPDGQPRELWAATVLQGGDYEAIRKPVKRWSPERKARNRRQRLRRRLEKKTPLLADLLFAEEVARRPAYFDAAAIAREDAERDEHT